MPTYASFNTVITVAFAEVDGSPTERITERGFEATRILTCKWSDRIKLAGELRGSFNQGINLVTRVIGHRYPDKLNAIAMDVSIKPFHKLNKPQASGSTALNEYDEVNGAELTVLYRIPDGLDEPSPDQDPQDIFITENLEPSAEFLTIPTEKLFFDTGAAEPIDASPAFILVAIDWVYTIHNLKKVPPGTFDLIGKSNKLAHESKKFERTFAPETLLFNPPSLDPRINTDGEQRYTITYRMTHRPVGWNKKLKPGEFEGTGDDRFPKFVPIFTDDGKVYKIYQPKSFNGILST